VKPTYFRTPAAFRAWLEKHHDTRTELWIGYFKKSSGKGGMVYKQALDEALCFGWIDGVVKSIDSERYMQRYTPRTKDSHWSLVNVRRFAELEAAGLIAPPGRAAFGRRTAERTGKASYESPPAEFTPAQKTALKANAKASAFFAAQPPGYQRVVKHFVTSAKQEATRERRMKLFLDCSSRGERVPQFISPVGKK
jgi:uncharacterized protein YdeI (YjbR/CyaY-like superfamily)